MANFSPVYINSTTAEKYTTNAQNEILEHKARLRLLSHLEEQVKAWGNKVVNKRFIDPLAARIAEDMNDGNRWHTFGISLKEGVAKYQPCWTFVLHVRVNGGYETTELYNPYENSGEVPYIGSDRRINPDALAKAIASKQEYLLSRIKDLEDAITNVGKVEQTYKELGQYVAKVMETLPKEFRSPLFHGSPIEG